LETKNSLQKREYLDSVTKETMDKAARIKEITDPTATTVFCLTLKRGME
jgi:hypothetical protein